jgi:hypothetical protein
VIRATVIVPARDAEATLPRTLAALADQEGAPSFEVVVADDGSSDGTAAIAERAGVRVVHGHANAAVAAASGAVLAFCGADCRPSPGWLAAGTQALEDADLVQGRIMPEKRLGAGPLERDVSVTAETGLYDPGNLFVSRALFDRLGGLERPHAADASPRTPGSPGAPAAPAPARHSPPTPSSTVLHPPSSRSSTWRTPPGSGPCPPRSLNCPSSATPCCTAASSSTRGR